MKPQFNTAGYAAAVTPDDAGDPGTPIGLCLALTYSPDHDIVNKRTFDRLYVGVTGDIAIQDIRSGNSVAFGQVPVGELHVRGRRVLATGTAASEIVAIKDP